MFKMGDHIRVAHPVTKSDETIWVVLGGPTIGPDGYQYPYAIKMAGEHPADRASFALLPENAGRYEVVR